MDSLVLSAQSIFAARRGGFIDLEEFKRKIRKLGLAELNELSELLNAHAKARAMEADAHIEKIKARLFKPGMPF